MHYILLFIFTFSLDYINSMENLNPLQDNKKKYSTQSWMFDLKNEIQDTPLTELWIPGTHDSSSDKIKFTSEISSGGFLPTELEKLKYIGVGYIVNAVIAGFSKTQNLTIQEQLDRGARFLDIRVTWRDDKHSQDYWTYHGLYNETLTDVFQQINNFINYHPNEVIICEIGGFQNIKLHQHDEIAKIINSEFQDKILYSWEKNKGIFQENYIININLKKMYEKNKNIIILYKNMETAQKYNYYSSGHYMYGPWPNKQTTQELKGYLDNKFTTNYAGAFRKTSGILTPDQSTILSSLNIFNPKRIKHIKDMAKQVNPLLEYQWIPEWHKNEIQPNFIIVDYFNESVARSIIDQNLSKTNTISQ